MANCGICWRILWCCRSRNDRERKSSGPRDGRTYNTKESASKSRNSPFYNRTFKGAIVKWRIAGFAGGFFGVVGPGTIERENRQVREMAGGDFLSRSFLDLQH